MAEQRVTVIFRRRAVGAVAAVAVLQIVAAVATTVVWVSRTLFAGNACSPDCDLAGADRAGMVYVALVVASFVLTAGAMFVAWRRRRDLTWVPILGIAVIIGGLVLALGMFDRAMS